MTYYQDLSPCSYFSALRRRDLVNKLTAVGWLEEGYSVSVEGQLLPEFSVKLRELLRSPWQPLIAMGWHECSLCGRNEYLEPTHGVPLGVSNLWLPGGHTVYLAPSLLLHYVEAHGYVPPACFQEAVCACPATGSDAYFERLRESGLDPQTDFAPSPDRDCRC